MQIKQTRLDALLHANQLWILHCYLRFIVNVVVNPVSPIRPAILRFARRWGLIDLRDAELLQLVVTPSVLEIILTQIVYTRLFTCPSSIQSICHPFHTSLVSSAIAN